MHSTTRTNLHRRRPHPTQRLHDSFDRSSVNARSRVALSTFSFARAFVHRRAVHQVVDSLVRLLRRNRNCANDTIPRLASVTSSQASAIVKLKVSPHIPPELSHAIVFLLCAATFRIYTFQLRTG